MAGFDFETTTQIVSLSASIIAMFSTMYFWLVRCNRERPNVDFEQLGAVKGSAILPQQATELYQSLRPQDDEVMLGYWFDLALLNNSTLPNAVLNLVAEVLTHDDRWVPALVQVTSDQPLPINIAPLTTTRLSVQVATKAKGSYANTGFKEREAMAESALAQQQRPVIRLKMRGVRDVVFDFGVTREQDSKVLRMVTKDSLNARSKSSRSETNRAA